MSINPRDKFYHRGGISECFAYDTDDLYRGEAMDIDEAERRGYRPCKVCQPDK